MTIYEQYAQITKEIQSLEAKQEVIRADIEKELPEEGYKDEIITAFWKTVKKYTYSPKVSGLTEELKTTKKLEEENGTATFEESKQLAIKIK